MALVWHREVYFFFVAKVTSDSFVNGLVTGQVILNRKGIINEFSFEAENALKNFINADQQGAFDQISALSDIVSALNEHDIDPTLKRPHASSILIDSQLDEMLWRDHTWM